MDILYTPKEAERAATSRDSFSGRLLSDPHYDEAMMITGIIEKAIQATGKFKKILNAYATAYAETKDKLDVVRSEKIIRDLFKERTGMSMNEMRKLYVQREDNLTDVQRRSAYPYAEQIGPMIENGNKMTSHRATSHQAKSLAVELSITDLGAKRLMSEQFEIVTGKKLYDWGKEQQDLYCKPQIEAEKQERKALQNNVKTHEYSR